MFDEKVFIAQVEQAQAEEFADIMTRPSAEQEKALRAHLGDHRYQRMHAMALRGNVTRATGRTKGNVLVVHGSMGSELSIVGPNERTQIWVHALRLMDGQLSRLRMAEARVGRAASESIHATGIMKRHYGELLLTLAQHWSVRAFWYDWRRGTEYAALRLQGLLADWFDERDPIHFVAHGLGGLVVRALIQRDPDRWNGCLTTDKNGDAGGRLVMLGTPHHGSFTIPQLLAGIDPLTKQLAQLDRRHDDSEVQAVVSSFPGLYEMLPSPLLLPDLEPLFQAETYLPARVSQRHLDNARLNYESRHDPADDGRLVQVVGFGQPTLSGISNPTRVCDLKAYQASFAGDGRVPLNLAELKTSGESGQPIRTYYVKENHGTLTANEQVLSALDELLETGTTSLLDDRPPAGETLGRDARDGLERAQDKCAASLGQRVERLRARGTRDPAVGVGYVTFDERNAEELITRDVLSLPVRAQTANLQMPPPGRITLAVEHDLIHKPDLRSGDLPIDAIAVGHYEQVRPAGAELQLDQAISSALRPAGAARHNGGAVSDSGILTEYTERGIIRGDLGQPFFLPDPRVAPNDPAGRLIVLAGMGAPGRFGAPELTVLARELCWSLGRMGKKHLATLLIGAGYGNLTEAEAVDAWIRGIKHALSGTIEGDDRKLQRITFIEADGAKIRGIQHAILQAKQRLKEQERLEIEYERLPKKRLDEIKDHNLVAARRRPPSVDPPPTRISYTMDFGSYRFGAITQDASIPEREIPLDTKLVDQANNELAAEWNPAMQLERGRFLERLLIPRDLRDQLASLRPIVMSVDATTARIHWELLAQPTFGDVEDPDGTAAAEPGRDFLGTTRGLTRQLRTTFAPPPEPPPPARRVLRVLVVADPAEDAPLRGAQEEGVEVADLFSAFNLSHGPAVESKVLVTALLGPREATRTNVLRRLMLHSFDVLHFAGHARYDPDTRTSGWLFSDGELVTANELNRIDRIPKFVFSNACESGITPDRSEQRSVDLAPNFAESFFARGVSNFVCTAWPVEDLAARKFALTLYQRLLGLSPDPGRAGRYRPDTPAPMHIAMQQARLKVTEPPFTGSRTWGAYQHYGNPFFRLFQEPTLTGRRGGAKKPKPGSQGDETKAKPSPAALASAAEPGPPTPAAQPPASA
jgi:CHAT domain